MAVVLDAHTSAAPRSSSSSAARVATPVHCDSTVAGVPVTNLASATVSMSGAYAAALPSVNGPEAVVSVSGTDLSQKLFHE
jgi:hypothetical protein